MIPGLSQSPTLRVFQKPICLELIGAIYNGAKQFSNGAGDAIHANILSKRHISMLAFHGEDGRCLHVNLPVRHLLQMSTKPVARRVTIATRAGCVWRGMGHNTPFEGRGSRNAAEVDPHDPT